MGADPLTGHVIEKPTYIGSVQLLSYWDGMSVNIDMRVGDNLAQILLSSNPNIVNGFKVVSPTSRPVLAPVTPTSSGSTRTTKLAHQRPAASR
jgi:hypothetical protein